MRDFIVNATYSVGMHLNLKAAHSGTPLRTYFHCISFKARMHGHVIPDDEALQTELGLHPFLNEHQRYS